MYYQPKGSTLIGLNISVFSVGVVVAHGSEAAVLRVGTYHVSTLAS